MNINMEGKDAVIKGSPKELHELLSFARYAALGDSNHRFPKNASNAKVKYGWYTILRDTLKVINPS